MKNESYTSREDSQLLRSVLSSERGGSLIEIGAGYGSNLKSVSGNFHLAVGTDIRKTDAFEILRNTGIELVLTDRASCFRPSTFDLVAMNPPYVPSEGIEDLSTDGGRGGFEIPRLFLDDALRVMKIEGRALIVLSSETDLDEFMEYCVRNSIKFVSLAEKRLFFETLFVFELERESASKIASMSQHFESRSE
ncbi:MAG: hypothetical protein ACRECH_09000 [Nitrososphaerales archaeon]